MRAKLVGKLERGRHREVAHRGWKFPAGRGVEKGRVSLPSTPRTGRCAQGYGRGQECPAACLAPVFPPRCLVIEGLIQASRPCGQSVVAVATACPANFPLGFGFRGSAWPSLNFFPLWLRREHLQLPRPLAGEAAVPEGSGGSWMDLGSAGTRSSPPPPLSGQFCQSQEVWQFIAADVACSPP